jgi:hypothetical protein
MLLTTIRGLVQCSLKDERVGASRGDRIPNVWSATV